MTASPEHDERVMVIVTAALDKSATQRDAYLRMACAGNDELYREVAEVVTCEEMMGRFSCTPCWLSRNQRGRSARTNRLGPVRNCPEIGEGGMGVRRQLLFPCQLLFPFNDNQNSRWLLEHRLSFPWLRCSCCRQDRSGALKSGAQGLPATTVNGRPCLRRLRGHPARVRDSSWLPPFDSWGCSVPR